MVRSQNCFRTIASVAALVAAIFVAPVSEARADLAVTANPAAFGGSTARAGVRIAADAARLSGRKVIVACSAGSQEWGQRVAAVGLPGAAEEYYGFSLIRRGEVHLSPYVCEGLRFGASASFRRSHEMQVAWSLNVLIHESMHLGRSSADERLAEACARVALPRELHRLYGVEYRSAEMRRLTAGAARFRKTMSAEYQGGSCSSPGA